MHTPLVILIQLMSRIRAVAGFDAENEEERPVSVLANVLLYNYVEFCSYNMMAA